LSYIIDPFVAKPGTPIPNSHTHYWESWQIAQTYLKLGYAVDAISHRNNTFVPETEYAIFIAARSNFEFVARRLNPGCIKVAHLDTAHWLFNNARAYQRCMQVFRERQVSLASFKLVRPNRAIERADYGVVLGNQYTLDTYRYAQKPLLSLSVPTCLTYPWPKEKRFDDCRKRFLWFGSRGFVHKGLDLVLQAFAAMPDYSLTVCGPMDQEKAFVQAFHKELYDTPNIQAVGWVDVGSALFTEIVHRCVGLVYPSCAEGQSGAVATCLQAGLIPIVSYESGLDVDGFGRVLYECSLDEIQCAVRAVSELPAKKLEEMARGAWEYARKHNSRERYAQDYLKIASFLADVASEARGEAPEGWVAAQASHAVDGGGGVSSA
jgi:glycosyltransferase involved in cell wall biosynthesis